MPYLYSKKLLIKFFAYIFFGKKRFSVLYFPNNASYKANAGVVTEN